MTRDHARQLAQREVDTISTRGGVPIGLDDHATIETDWCWVFIYQSRAYLDGGRERDRLWERADRDRQSHGQRLFAGYRPSNRPGIGSPQEESRSGQRRPGTMK